MKAMCFAVEDAVFWLLQISLRVGPRPGSWFTVKLARGQQP